MTASELRIGNYVLDELGLFEEVDIESLLNNKFKQYSPIPLTEEWLIKLGLIKVIGWDDMVFWRMPEDKNSNDCFELMETLQGYELPSGKICEFVHQLQNCYFFHELTGKELKISQ